MSSRPSTIPPPSNTNFARTAKTGLIVLFSLTAAAWFSSRVLLSTDFLPHWYCFVGNKRLLWTNVIADLVIGVSYVVISATLALLVRRAGRDLPYSGFFWAFGLFIVSCGATHFMEILTVWMPVYWLSAAVKIVTATASAGTAVVLPIAADDIVDFVHTAREAAARRGYERFRALIHAAPMGVVSSKATGVLYDSYRQNLRRKGLEEEQKRLESQVRQSQKMEVLGRLAGGVAHDFNNMLMVLGGCSELLDRSLPSESPARMYLDQIQRTTEKAAAITKQLLAFSRKQVVEFRLMDLHEALSESEFMLPRLLGSDIELTFHHSATQSWILSDPSQIEQVVANLAINSRDAMPQGGPLAISTRNTTRPPEDSVHVSSNNEGNWLVLEVADTGLGMDEKTRTQIFEPFFTTKPAGKGTGLGLATVYGIVKQSNGFIRVDTAPAKGTRFEIYFPTATPPPSFTQNAPSKEMSDSNGSGETILVADDETALRHAVVEILRSSGYKALEAQTATEALEMANQHAGKLDILLTDVVMPGLRGPELARRVTQTHPDIRVVYMSGYAEGFPETQLPENSAFLQKPFRFATLLEQLKLIRRKA
jgi:signal transduction histidine kinase/CheY-like chemotaxis protein